MKKLYKPIFIVGSVRSGTTMLGEILSQHPDVAYWLEPKYIWKYKNAKVRHDHREQEEATPRVKKYIRSRFHKFTFKKSKKRFIEKTPSNVFRIPFMYEIFPEGLFVNIIRNGNDCVLSAEKKWTSPPSKSAIKRRLLSNEIPLADLPFYFVDTIQQVIGRFFLPKKGFIWGQEFKGIYEYRKQHSILETCAMQWRKGVEASRMAFKKIPSKQVYEIHYENLLADPERELKPLLEFLELSNESVIEYAQNSIKSTRTKNYSQVEIEKLNQIEHILKPEMDLINRENKLNKAG